MRDMKKTAGKAYLRPHGRLPRPARVPVAPQHRVQRHEARLHRGAEAVEGHQRPVPLRPALRGRQGVAREPPGAHEGGARRAVGQHAPSGRLVQQIQAAQPLRRAQRAS